MPTLSRLLLAVCFVALSCAPAYAQSEPELKDFFEGKSVVVKLDMPATQEGIDVFPDARRAIDFAQYSARLKSTGVVVTATYSRGDQVITADFVEGVLIKYSISSK